MYGSKVRVLRKLKNKQKTNRNYAVVRLSFVFRKELISWEKMRATQDTVRRYKTSVRSQGEGRQEIEDKKKQKNTQKYLTLRLS